MNNKVAKRNNMVFELIRSLVAIAISLLIVVLILFLVSDDPAFAIKEMLLGPFASKRRIGNIVELAIPLTFCGLAIAVTFRAKQYNLIADGAFMAGGMSASLVAIFFKAPAPIIVIVALIVSIITGAFLGTIPAMMKQKLGASELVTSLMLNYAAVLIVQYFLVNVVRDVGSATVQSVALPDGVNLGSFIKGTRIHYGIFIAVFCVAFCTFFMYKSKKGYELRMTGSNPDFAHYSGIPVGATIFGAQVFGSALAGLGGAVEVIGLYGKFKWVISPNYGFDGIIIATLARNNPILVPVAALFFAYLRNGSEILNRSAGIPYEIVSIVQAPIILFIAAKAFLSYFKQKSLEKQAIGNSEEPQVAPAAEV